MEAYYRSCDPLQDISFTASPCLNIRDENINLKLSLMLRQSIDELYASIDFFLNQQPNPVAHIDESLCLPDFPGFSFCGRKKGEVVTIERSVRISKVATGRIDIHIVMFNQNGFQILCTNATVILK
ncbi:lymphocyte antigen 86 [Chanos chanos]|uniref:Lymphocyte antigen 86 n=1 Tax=Chanos chanos TaxID=29144 RepID=A0A6J2UWM1_CHACN|nr:lymphocyte antigen 86 [Chanos chanos]